MLRCNIRPSVSRQRCLSYQCKSSISRKFRRYLRSTEKTLKSVNIHWLKKRLSFTHHYWTNFEKRIRRTKILFAKRRLHTCWMKIKIISPHKFSHKINILHLVLQSITNNILFDIIRAFLYTIQPKPSDIQYVAFE